jgi:uncharacterized protein
MNGRSLSVTTTTCARAATLCARWRLLAVAALLLSGPIADATEAKSPRPQTPQPPFPYRVEDVSFPSVAPGITLAGTLTQPQDAAPVAALVLVAGSGKFDRDEVVARHRIFLVWADYFTRRGFAVLRSDKRGVGKSTGNYAAATNDDFANDAEGALAYLRGRLGRTGPAIGLVGHSGGATVASIVAARRPEVSFVVLVGGSGVRGVDIIVAQDIDQARLDGLSDALIAKREAMDRELLELVAREKDSPALEQDVARVAARQQPEYPYSGKPAPVAETVANVTGAWFREDMAYDPIPTLQRIRCPILVVAGTLDHQVFPRQNLPPIAAALKADGNRDATILELPGVNHLLQEARTGLSSEYGTLEQTASMGALKQIGDWIARHAAQPDP